MKKTRENEPPINSNFQIQILNEFAGRGLAVFINEEGKVCFNLESNPALPKVAILSIPKSGTYLSATILNKCGYNNCGIHILESCASDIRSVWDPTLLRSCPAAFLREVSMRDSLSLVLPGQYCCSHAGFSPESLELLTGFRRIFVYRNLREVIISWVRFASENLHISKEDQNWARQYSLQLRVSGWLEANGSGFLKWITTMAGWKEDAQTVSICYENLKEIGASEDPQIHLDPLADQVGVDANNLRTAIIESFGEKSITKNEVPSDRNTGWDENCEKLFIEIGFDSLDQRLRPDIIS